MMGGTSRADTITFSKSSTRTRLRLESARLELGGHAIFLDARTTQLDFPISMMKFKHNAIWRCAYVS